MSSPDGNSTREQRPSFMVKLELLPPYTPEDVKEAYMEKVNLAHPDHGGNITEFRAIQDAYEEAKRYLAFNSDKRAWIAAQMDRYVALQELESKLVKLGATVTDQPIEWLQRSYGDFAELTAAVQSIELRDSDHGQAVVNLLVANQSIVNSLKRLRLVGCGLTDETALRLSCLEMLEHLDLSQNPLSKQVIGLVASIPTLTQFELAGTSVGTWDKMKLASQLRKRSRSGT